MESDLQPTNLVVTEPVREAVPTYWRVLAICGAVLLTGFLLAPLFFQPSEDAVILYQYATNLAHTGVISFIPNGPPAEGATDFLWMGYIAAGRALGIPSYGLSIAITVEAIVLLAITLLGLARQRYTVWNIGALVFLLMLAPQMFAAEAGFSVYAFALCLATMAAAAYNNRYGSAALSGLLLCLIRPDGAVFALPVLIVYLFEGDKSRTRIRQLLAGFVLPGVVYFLWRWHYFGHFLPLPFYVKSDTPRVAGFLVVKSAMGLAPPLLAACAVLWIILRERLFARRNWLLFLTMVGPASLFYMTMRLDQNYANRFFLYPLVVMGVLLAANYESYKPQAGRALLAGLGVWVIMLAYFWVNWLVIYTLDYPQPQVAAVARALGKMPVKGTMIVTESGAIAYYSHWTAYDPWGLNTPEFATRLIQPDDVRRLRPDLIIVHEDAGPVPCVLPMGTPVPHRKRTWNNMADNVLQGVDPGGYTQWLLPQFNGYYRTHPTRWNGEKRWGRTDYQCWFIRNQYPQRAEVMDILQKNGGVSAANYVPDTGNTVQYVPAQRCFWCWIERMR